MRNLTLLFIGVLCFTSIKAQVDDSNCDSLMYILVRNMPCYFGDYDKTIEQINVKTANMINSLTEKDKRIKFSVLCNGRITVRTQENSETMFTKIIEGEFNKLKWIPAFTEGKPVNIQTVLPVFTNNNKIKIPKLYSEFKGEVIACIILDEDTGAPIENAKIFTKYNNYSCFSNASGEVSFYSEPNMPVEISHINYTPVNFSIIEKNSSYKILLKKVNYILEDLDLIKNSPKRLPKKNAECSFIDWKENRQNFIFLNPNNYFPSELAQFNDGYDCLQNYICKNFILPKEAIMDNYADTVVVSFTVEKEGITNNVVLSK